MRTSTDVKSARVFSIAVTSKSGVLACPNGTYAPVERSAGVRHCFCDSGTAAVGRGALTGANGGSGCQSCLENEICNAVNNRREKRSRVFKLEAGRQVPEADHGHGYFRVCMQ